MTWRDKFELGLKEDAAYRKDNLPPSQIRGPELPTGPGRSPEIPLARGDQTEAPIDAVAGPTPSKPHRTARVAVSFSEAQRVGHGSVESLLPVTNGMPGWRNWQTHGT